MKKKIKNKKKFWQVFSLQVSSTHELLKALLWELGHVGQRTGHTTSRYVAASHWSTHWSCHALFSHTQQNLQRTPRHICVQYDSGACVLRTVQWSVSGSRRLSDSSSSVRARAREEELFLSRISYIHFARAWKRIHRIHVLRILFTLFTSLHFRVVNSQERAMIALESFLSEFSSGSLD